MIELQIIWNIISSVVPIILTLIVYWFGVIKTNEKQSVEIENIKRMAETTNDRIDRLDEEKADKYTIEMVITTLNRIDCKIDRLQEQINII